MAKGSDTTAANEPVSQPFVGKFLSESVDVQQTSISGAASRPSTSASEVILHLDPDFDFDDPASPGLSVEEEGEISDQETSSLTQESDQHISEKQTYR